MVEKSLHGKTALVTGAGARLGKAVAIALAGEGVNVVIHYRSSEDGAKSLCGEIEEKGARAWLVKADFESKEEYGSLIRRAAEASGGFDILINSASIFFKNTLEDVDFDSVARHMRVNAWVPFALSRDFSRTVKRGKIINLLDSRLIGYDWEHVAYILSKYALSVLTRMTALEFAPGITVNGVSPGLILPPPGKDEGYLDGLAHNLPLRRHGGPEDVAAAVIYLLKNDFLTGTVINVDGGRHLRWETDGQHTD